MSHLPSNNQSWLDPSGNFHPIDRSVFLSHEAWAKGNWKTLGFKTKYKFPPTALYKKGWLLQIYNNLLNLERILLRQLMGLFCTHKLLLDKCFFVVLQELKQKISY